MEQLKFKDKEHRQFYEEKIEMLGADEYLRSLIYLIGLSSMLRKQWRNIYQEKHKIIKPKVLREPWQTGTSVKILRLAFQLYTDRTITDTDFETEEEDIEECRRYSVSDIFCCDYAPFFVEAVKLRYPCYF